MTESAAITTTEEHGRGELLKTALAVVSLRDTLGHNPTAQELMERLGMTRRSAYRWASAARCVLGSAS